MPPRPKALVPREVLAANGRLRNRHAGQRHFIVGNGPSVKQIDLCRLRGETVFSVSNGYLHEGYAAMAPRRTTACRRSPMAG